MNGSLLLDDLADRGLVHDSTDLDALRSRLAEGPISVYCGFDPTADSLHIGSLVPLLLLRRFQEAGHRPIALVGGATGMVGDPSFREAERPMLDAETLDRYLVGIEEQLRRFLDFGQTGTGARLVDNRTWTAPLSLLDFLRDVGKHVTVNAMLAKESVRARLAGGTGISYTEFTYMLLQANDYAWLHGHEECELQVGGSDQWGNITAGIDLVRRRSGATVHGLTHPLLMRADGQKFGKSQGVNIWLSAERTSPYQLYQYFMQVDDRDVERFLLQLTLLSIDEVSSIATEHREDPGRRSAQRRLAGAVAALVHGVEEADAAREASAILFGRSGDTPGAGALATLVGEVPTTAVAALPADPVELLVGTDLATSKSDARRALRAGELTVNARRIDETVTTTSDWLIHERYVLLRRGKKRYHLITVDPVASR